MHRALGLAEVKYFVLALVVALAPLPFSSLPAVYSADDNRAGHRGARHAPGATGLLDQGLGRSGYGRPSGVCSSALKPRTSGRIAGAGWDSSNLLLGARDYRTWILGLSRRRHYSAQGARRGPLLRSCAFPRPQAFQRQVRLTPAPAVVAPASGRLLRFATNV